MRTLDAGTMGGDAGWGFRLVMLLVTIGDYVTTGMPVNFQTVVAAARQRGETAIGYRILHESHIAEKSYGVHTNPRKSAAVAFVPEDKVIVIAEE